MNDYFKLGIFVGMVIATVLIIGFQQILPVKMSKNYAVGFKDGYEKRSFEVNRDKVGQEDTVFVKYSSNVPFLLKINYWGVDGLLDSSKLLQIDSVVEKSISVDDTSDTFIKVHSGLDVEYDAMKSKGLK